MSDFLFPEKSCLFLLVALQILFFVFLYFRFRARNKLVRSSGPWFRETSYAEHWRSTFGGFLGREKRIRLIRRCKHLLPPELQAECRKYTVANYATWVSVGMLFLPAGGFAPSVRMRPMLLEGSRHPREQEV